MNVIYTLKENGIQVEEKTAFLKRQKNKTISLNGLTKVYVSFNKPSGKLAVFTLFFGRRKIQLFTDNQENIKELYKRIQNQYPRISFVEDNAALW